MCLPFPPGIRKSRLYLLLSDWTPAFFIDKSRTNWGTGLASDPPLILTLIFEEEKEGALSREQGAHRTGACCLDSAVVLGLMFLTCLVPSEPPMTVHSGLTTQSSLSRRKAKKKQDPLQARQPGAYG